MRILVDADACPVKEEIYRVARRHSARVFVVSNAPMFVPKEDLIELVVVRGGFDAADDWIADRAGDTDVVITSDIPLAERCLKVSARVLGPTGRVFTEDAIGDAMATRALHDMLRQSGEFGGGPKPFTKTDRSKFLSKLDETLHAVRKQMGKRQQPGS
ncbi:YaiI/YqxD family protein [Aquisphaera insulae]|uniref:YaiI/YqxD family protein n=1 Tax=Aquisphaera insulae TaxID=2712864 RepID=UPI0013EBD8D9|nr:YaiI/YqxD family protein [Aquisphaera insulae]